MRGGVAVERIVLKAKKGMVLTNGTDYGRQIFLAEGVDASSYHEITEAEYEKIMAEEGGEEGPYNGDSNPTD